MNKAAIYIGLLGILALAIVNIIGYKEKSHVTYHTGGYLSVLIDSSEIYCPFINQG